MGKKKQETTIPVPGINILNQAPADGQLLLIRHVRVGGAISLRSGMRGLEADPDITLDRRCEQVVSSQWAKTSADLKKYVKLGWLEVSWVDQNYEPRVSMPLPEDAPADIITHLTKAERQFALDSIAMQGDLALALAAVNTQVKQPEPRDRMTDSRFMRDHFYYVLELADWLEEQIDDRPKVHAAIKAAKAAIRDM